MEQQLKNIAQQFAIEGEIADIRPLGNGLINTTYAVTTTGSTPDYVLQNVNVAIFPDIKLLMNNIVEVTTHIRKKLEAAGTPDIDRKVLNFVPTKEGVYYYFDGEKYWRVMVLISDTTSKSGVSIENAKIVGKTFAEFQGMLADIPAELGETIKDFHNIEFRLKQLKEAVADDKVGRVGESTVAHLLEEIFKREDEMTKSEKLYREGKLPKRICHCDTKVDNILFDKEGNVLCVIDLDTVMPSFIFSDFGDFLRTAANTTREDDPNLDNISFRFDVFEAFAGGYLAGGAHRNREFTLCCSSLPLYAVYPLLGRLHQRRYLLQDYASSPQPRTCGQSIPLARMRRRSYSQDGGLHPTTACEIIYPR